MSDEKVPSPGAEHTKPAAFAAEPLRDGDFYMEHGLLVFTEAYHLRRGYCCNSDCRHCPYRT